jgi:hypothetical protein
VLRVGQPGHDNPVQVSNERIERLGCLGRNSWQRGHHFARSDIGTHGQVSDLQPVIGHPINEFMSGLAELFGAHAESLSRTSLWAQRNTIALELPIFGRHSSTCGAAVDPGAGVDPGAPVDLGVAAAPLGRCCAFAVPQSRRLDS